MTASLPSQQSEATTPLTAARIVDGVKVYGTGVTAVRALDGITANFASGRFTAIMGPSGSGKSTLLHCLAGLDRLTSGEVYVGEQCLNGLKDAEMTRIRRDRIGFVFQTFNLLPTLSARENILLPLSLGRKHPDPTWFEALITALGIGDRLRHRPAELSGGQQQRVAMARALITRPELVFADEPTGNLDSRSATELLGQMRAAVDDFGQSVVMVTHDVHAAGYADRVVFLADGRAVDELIDPTTDRLIEIVRTLGKPE